MSFVADRAAYGSDTAHGLLKQLKSYGVDSIAIVIQASHRGQAVSEKAMPKSNCSRAGRMRWE